MMNPMPAAALPATHPLAGVECPHGMDDPMWCTTCKTRLGYRSGTTRQANDCSVVAFTHLTGAAYTEAEALLAEAGKATGNGAHLPVLLAALQAAGFTATEVHAPTSTGAYLVAAWRGKAGHAMAVVDGKLHNGSREWLQARTRKVYRVA